MAVSMQKIEAEAPALVSLAKKAAFSISKHGLEGQVARVALCLDYSGSAQDLYRMGVMQKVAERALAVATQFDDDGEIEVFLFHHEAWFAGTLNLSNYQGGIQRLIAGRQMGGTAYSAAFDTVREYYFPSGDAAAPAAAESAPRRSIFGRRNATPTSPATTSVQEHDTTVPVYVAFFTDGATSAPHLALTAARRTSEHPMFFQAVGLGDPDYFGFIEEDLNQHGGRVDNFGFFTSEDITTLGDAQLLDGLLNEFPGALQKMRNAGTLTA